MKQLLSFLFTLFLLDASSQILTIPDANFKTALLYHNPVIDQNQDGEIQLSEAQATYKMNITSMNVSDFTGIQSFSNLDTLYCSENPMSTIDLSNMTHLTHLTLYSNHSLTSVNLTNCPTLSIVSLESNQLTAIDFSGAPNITDLVLVNNALTSLDISGLTSLNYLDCSTNLLSSLTIANLPLLELAQVHHNNLTNLNLNNCPLLAVLLCNDNQLTTIDASGLVAIGNINCSQNPLLNSINIKNGPAPTTTLTIDNDPALQYICADEAEYSYLQNQLASFPNISINSYCSFQPGGGFNTISGILKADENNNGCDAADPVVSHLKVTIDDGTQTGSLQTLNSGSYSFYTNDGNFTITPDPINSYYSASPASASVNFANANGNLNTADFCFAALGNHQDVSIVIIPVNPARPGFVATYKIIYTNTGTTSLLSGNAHVDFNEAKLDLVTATPAASLQSPGALDWTYTNLQPLESRSITLMFQVLPPPITNIGEVLNFVANVTPLGGDEKPSDNTAALKQTVVGSFDPNDKTCLEGKFIDITKVGEYLHYLIHFQNSGTDTAFNIVVKDLLSDKYDWNSLQLIDASHPCVLKQTQGNKLEFLFTNINLPAQSINDAGSQGYVAFQIKPAGTVAFNDSLINTASIFFDFNLPVVTNDAITIIDSLDLLPVIFEYFKGQKQETKNILTWKANCNTSSVSFQVERSSDNRNFISIGNITASNNRCLLPFNFTDNDPGLNINYYRIAMKDESGKIVYSNIIALLNRKSGFEIISLAPNPVAGKAAFLDVTSAQPQQLNITIADANGRSVYAIAQTVAAGSTQIEMNVSKLAKGIYNILIHTGEGESKMLQFVKQ